MYIRDGFIEVRAPFFYSMSEINRFVVSREKWAVEKLAESKARIAKRESFRLAYGSEIAYRGKPYPISGRQGDIAGFDVSGFYVPPDLTTEGIKRCCMKTYRLLAERYLTDRTFDYARRMSVKPASIRVSNAKSRWGSCSAKKNVNFSWRLIMADDEVIDYVVVHELAHLIEYNHSTRFWKIVGTYLPDYKERRAKLKVLHEKLGVEDWD